MTWTDGQGLFYQGDCMPGHRAATSVENAAWQAQIATTSILTFEQFMALFTQSEQSAIVNSTDTKVKILVLRATGSDAIRLSDPNIQQGVQYLVSLNILSSARATVVLSGQPPSS